MQARKWSSLGPAICGLFVALCWLMLAGARIAQANAPVIGWEELQRGGHVILLRHATTDPGTGDPPGFNLKECRTQRNLSVAEHRIPISGVFTSEWCRCRDTATIAFGRASEWSALNSFFDSPQNEPRQTTTVKKRLPAMLQPGKNIVIVSHQLNITALTGVAPQMGEAIIAKFDANGALQISGRLLVE
jgi:broad specificity phosphatase PhoE